MRGADQRFWSRGAIGLWSVAVLLALIVLTIVRLEASLYDVAPLELELDGPGENVDDPCFWVDPADPSDSLIFITTKDSGLVEVFGAVTGEFVTTIPGFGLPNNCAVEGDLLLTTDRGENDVKVHTIPDLTLVRTFGQDMREPEGIDVLDTPEGQKLVYVTDSSDASVHVYDLATGTLVRDFSTGFGDGIEPVLADDLYQRIFVARGEKESKLGIGVFEPGGTRLFEFGAEVFSKDAEGLAIYACGDGGYLIAADQKSDATDFEIFDRVTLEHLGTFHLKDGGSDFTNSTDGIDILQTPLPGFPNGALAACDGCGSDRPDEMDVIGWDSIAEVMGLALCPNNEEPDCVSVPCTERFIVNADAFVNGAQPNTNFGSANTLEIELDPAGVRQTLLRVDVPDLTGFEILDAVLRLRVTDESSGASDDGGTLFVTTGDWTEGGVTFNNRPMSLGEPIDTAGAVQTSARVDFDVSEVVVGGGTYNFLLLSSSANKAAYYSREADVGPPTLVLRLKANPPDVTITSPDGDTVIAPGVPLVLSGAAVDAEDGDLSFAMRWRSDLDGELGEGASLTVSTLTLGLHTIIAEVVDGTGLRGSASVVVVVNVRPTVKITSPADGARFHANEPALFTAAADDDEDGDLTSAITWTSDLDGALGTGGSVPVTTLRPAAHRVTASVTDAAGESASDQVTVIINATPTVAITAPANGSVFEPGAPVVLGGTAADAEDGDLSAAIRWTSDLDGALGMGGSITTSALTRSGAHTVAAEVADSAGKTVSASIRVIVNASPSVAITAPANGSVFQRGETVSFAGTATDAEDGDLGAAIRWTSDLDGALGMGGSITTNSLVTPAAHTVTAEVIDSGGKTARATIAIIVNAAPTVQITAPFDGGTVAGGTPLKLSATALDPTDGDLGAALEWVSDRDGHLGTGASMVVTPSEGTHVLSAQVRDSNGALGEDHVTVVVTPTPPIVTVTSPPDGLAMVVGDALRLAGSAVDFRDGGLGGAIVWESSLQGRLGTGAALIVRGLSLGEHVITASATDSDLLTGQASLRVRVIAPTMELEPEADAYVESSLPDQNFGVATTLQADASPQRQAFFRFNVTGMAGVLIDRAILRLTVSDASGSSSEHGGTLRTVSDTGWEESKITYRNRPPVDGPVLGSNGPVATGAIVEFDVTPVVAGEGRVAFALVTASSDAVKYRSRESSSGRPTLVLSLRSPYVLDGEPTVAIEAPVDGSGVRSDMPVTFSATATDTGDGDLSSTVVWSSDLAGPLGTGSPLTVPGLPGGVHVIRAEVADSDGFSASAEITLFVSSPPTVIVLSPPDGAVSEAGAAITLTATASDSEDGDLSHAVVWESDLQGRLGTGATVVASGLMPGMHVITAGATDSSFVTGQASVRVGVISGTLRLEAEADAYVDSSSPAKNFGTAATLEADASPVRQAFVRFSVPATGEAEISRAVLRLTVSSTSAADSNKGGTLHTISNSGWGEGTITYANRPPVDGPVLGTKGPVAAGQVVEFDVTPAVTGGGRAAFALVTTSSDAVKYNSREAGSGGPALVIDLRLPELPNVSPRVAITAPLDGTVVGAATPVLFVGAATDPEDGDLSGTIEWRSDREGLLGTGGTLSAALSAGTHRVTASIVDSFGATGSATVQVRVVDEPPVVTILAPADGMAITMGEAVLLRGIAVDVVDGDLSGDLEWVSSLDGTLGSGPSLLVASLNAGQHEITASATDSGGSVATASVRIAVKPASRVFDAIADAFVVETAPDSRFGADTHLIIKHDSPAIQVFLKFQVSGTQGMAVRQARVRMTVDTPSSAGSGGGGQIHAVPDAGWKELVLTYSGRPLIDQVVLDTMGPVRPGEIVEFDVTPAVSGDGMYGFAVVGTDADAAVYRSREAAGGGPQLILSLGLEY